MRFLKIFQIVVIITDWVHYRYSMILLDLPLLHLDTVVQCSDIHTLNDSLLILHHVPQRIYGNGQGILRDYRWLKCWTCRDHKNYHISEHIWPNHYFKIFYFYSRMGLVHILHWCKILYHLVSNIKIYLEQESLFFRQTTCLPSSPSTSPPGEGGPCDLSQCIMGKVTWDPPKYYGIKLDRQTDWLTDKQDWKHYLPANYVCGR